MIDIKIEACSLYADLIGTLSDGRIACMGFVGQKTQVERACVRLYKGDSVLVGPTVHQTLGGKAYRVYKSQLPYSLARAYIIPSNTVTSFDNSASSKDKDAEGDEGKTQKAKPVPPVLMWRDGQDDSLDTRIWRHLQNDMPIPLLDEWQEAVMARLWRDSELADSDQRSLDPIRFEPDGDGRWGGVAIRLSPDTLASAVRDALVAGDITHPSPADLGLTSSNDLMEGTYAA